MRDVSNKIDTSRMARARGVLRMARSTYELIGRGEVPKGDPLPVSKVAAVQAAKNTPLLLPYCHPVPVDYVGVEFDVQPDRITVETTVKATYRTGVEMEALAAAAAAVLNLYDMLKMLDEEMRIEAIELLEKRGGKSDFGSVRSFQAAVLVVSDRVSRGEAEDRSGVAIRERLERHGGTVRMLPPVPDERERIADAVRGAEADLVVLTGGTGLGPRDVTPESVAPLLDARLEGVEEAIRAYGQRRTPTAMLSRTVAGRMGEKLVLCLPGSTGGVEDALDAVFPHLLHALHVMEGGGH
jgi:cyclic pyranopterin monophosphate synthase